MIHRPKSIYGFAVLFLVALGVAGIAVPLAAIVWSPMLGASTAVAALAVVELVVWRRKVEARRERAWVGQFSFGDVIARMRAREATALPPPSVIEPGIAST